MPGKAWAEMIVRPAVSGGFVGFASRTLPAAAGLATLAGATIMLMALVAAPGSWLQGYVSEAGTAGQPHARAYRWGLILLAFGVFLLALSIHRLGRVASPRRAAVLLRGAAALLGSAAVLGATSGAVPCSNRCPLPPFEPTTAADVVHTAASIAGMAVLAGAMALIAVAPVRRTVRGLAAIAVACTVPLAACLGLTMLLVGRGPAAATAERALLVVAVSWLVGTAASFVFARPLDATT
jgi:Protein of unknown function (DUF998)